MLKQLGNYLAAWFKLGRTARLAKEASRGVLDLRQHGDIRLSELHDEVFTRVNELANELTRHIDEVAASQAHRQQSFENMLRETSRDSSRDLKTRHQELARSYAALSHRLDHVLLTLTGADPSPSLASKPEPEGLNALKDSVQSRLEALAPQATDVHLSQWLPEVESAVIRTDDLPVLDLYCGTGAWLALLVQAGLPATAAHGSTTLTAVQTWTQEARTALGKQDSDSLSVISARHLVASLPFDELLWLTREAMRVLAPGGMLMIETADAEAMGTGFYDDPDHIRPLTVRNLQAILETLGFEDITMQHLPTNNFVCLSVKPLPGT